MSDISINITWLDFLLYAPVIGWPGLLIGGALGVALFWKKRRVLGGIVGALLGSVAWAAALIFT